MTTTDFLGFEKPSKDDRIKIDVLNDNTDKIDNHFKRNSIVLSTTGKNISVDATGPYYTVTNNNADTVQVLLEGNSMLLDPGETFKMNKDATETFTLEVTCASDVTVTYFQRNKDYIDNSLTTNLSNYYDKDNSDGRYLQISDFGAARNEESSSVCSVDMPLKYTAYGNDVEQYKVYGKTSQVANPSPDFPKDVNGVGNLVTDPDSEHYGQYAIPIVCNGTTYNVYLDKPLYETNSVRDYIDYAKQKVIRKTGVITYDGSSDENWTSIEYQTYGIDVGVQVVDTTDNNFIDFMFCDKLSVSSSVSIFVNKIAIIGGKIAVHFDSSQTSVELFVAYLQSNPITVYFPLAEAVEEDVVLPDLPTIHGENQLYVDTDILPSIVSVSAALQYFSPREMYESFPSKDDFYTKAETEKYTTAEKNKLASITNPIKLKGRVDSISDLPTDAEIGWLYFVGTIETADKEEYVYTEDEAWEHIGASDVNLSDYYTKSEVDTELGDKADSSELASHTSNSDIHVTAADKTAWNSKVKSVTAAAINTASPSQVTISAVNTNGNVVISNNQTVRTIGKTTNGVGWYRIFEIGAEHRPQVDFTLSLHRTPYNGDPQTCKMLVSYASKTNPSIILTNKTPGYSTYSKIRFVRTDTNNTKAYIEVYNSTAGAQELSACISGLTGFNGTITSVNLITGAIPDGYTAYEYGITNSGVVSYTAVPATLTSSGTAGEIAYDSNYIYVCTATNTWKRAALSSW